MIGVLCGKIDTQSVTQINGHTKRGGLVKSMERARRFERPTPTLARLCSTPELRPLTDVSQRGDLRTSLPERRRK